MKKQIVFFLLLSATSLSAFAEGACPAGQYPVGGQGVQGCAPIPSAGGGSGDAQPNGRWIKTWGAIATAKSTGDMGASVGRESKAEAVAEASARCATYGAKDCVIGMTYKNQCVAYAAPQQGSMGKTSISTGASKEVATQEVMKYCASLGGGECKVLYADCSESIFHPYF